MSESKFVDGMIVKRNDKAPDFVIANLSFKAGEFVAFLGDNAVKGWLNVDIKRSKAGKLYAQVNTWTKDKKFDKEFDKKMAEEDTIEYGKGDTNPDEIPF